ncbi:aspartyl-phosphate phosphatase Spo0E family protein [Bacillus sp. REN10]|uniref:aspartyl-phosphate phosphatase Spo0E family protein n=1 Tax=Bacillus sp. REN10 TaxID=2782541 RepID=UPI001EEDD623|nr:aspartyl-phosphate phosphatase Spo0E family protein [Bacillus sp. REN10]
MKGFTGVSKEHLLDTIEKKRLELLDIVSIYGLNSPLAIQYSQELDTLLNDYDRNYIQPLVDKNKPLT